MKPFLKLLAYLIVAVVFLASCSNEHELKKKKEEQSKSQEKNQTILAVQQMVDEYEADTNWFKEADNAEFTLHIQKMILNKERQPKLVVGTLKDVWQDGPKKYLLLEDNSLFFPAIYYVLKLNDQQVKDILSEEAAKYSDFACVANILTAKRPVLTYSAKPEDQDFAEIYFYDAEALIASGQCIKILQVDGFTIYDLFPKSNSK